MSSFQFNNINPSYFVSDSSDIDVQKIFASPGIKPFDMEEFKKEGQRKEESLRQFQESQIKSVSGETLFTADMFRVSQEAESERLNNSIKLNQTMNHMSPDVFAEYERKAQEKYAISKQIQLPVPTVALTGDKPSIIDPEEFVQAYSNYDEITFRSGSLYGLLLDPQAQSPQFNELILDNAQTTKYFAMRIRGGVNGEFWNDTLERSTYLKRQFVEGPKTKAYLDEYVNLTPYGLDPRGMSFTYTGPNPLDILQAADEETPPGWDPQKAIEELKATNPALADHLFNVIGIDEKRFNDPLIGGNPQKFKFFIADAIDSYAAGRAAIEFEKYAEWTETWTGTVWPLIRDSLNSNDTIVDLGLTVTGAVVTAVATGATPFTLGASTTVAAPAAAVTAASATSLTLKLNRIWTGLSRIKRLVESNNRLYKTVAYSKLWANRVYNLAPHNLLETGMRYGASKSPFLKTALYGTKETNFAFKTLKSQGFSSFWKQTGFLYGAKSTLRYAARSGISGGSQGAVEDLLRQGYAYNAGYTDQFNSNAMLGNMLEESVGEVLLGGSLNFVAAAPRFGSEVLKQNFEFAKAFNKQAEKFKGVAWTKVQAKWNKLPETLRDKLALAARLQTGIDTANENLTPSQQVDIIVKGFEFQRQSRKLAAMSPEVGSIIDSDSTSEAVNKIINIFGEENNAQTRLEVFKTLQSALKRFTDTDGNVNLPGHEIENLFLTIVETQILSKADSQAKAVLYKKFVDAYTTATVDAKLKEAGKGVEEFKQTDKDTYNEMLIEEAKQLGLKTQAAKENWINLVSKTTPDSPINLEDPFLDIRYSLTISKETQDLIVEESKKFMEEEGEATVTVSINGVETIFKKENTTGKTADEIRQAEQKKINEYRKRHKKNPEGFKSQVPKKVGGTRVLDPTTGVWTDPQTQTVIQDAKVEKEFKSLVDLRNDLLSLSKEQIDKLKNGNRVFIAFDYGVGDNPLKPEYTEVVYEIVIESAPEGFELVGGTHKLFLLNHPSNLVYGIDTLLKAQDQSSKRIRLLVKPDSLKDYIYTVKHPYDYEWNTNADKVGVGKYKKPSLGLETPPYLEFVIADRSVDPKNLTFTPNGVISKPTVPVVSTAVSEIQKQAKVIPLKESEIDEIGKPTTETTTASKPDSKDISDDAPKTTLETALENTRKPIPETAVAPEIAPEAAPEIAPEAAPKVSKPIPKVDPELDKTPSKATVVKITDADLMDFLEGVDLESLATGEPTETTEKTRSDDISDDLCT